MKEEMTTIDAAPTAETLLNAREARSTLAPATTTDM